MYYELVTSIFGICSFCCSCELLETLLKSWTIRAIQPAFLIKVAQGNQDVHVCFN